MLNDPFEGMRYAINAMRLRLGTPTAMTCDQALRYQTMGAAEVLGSYDAFVYYARASDVTDSVIDGKVVMRERQLSGLDHRATLEKLQKRLPPWRSQLSALGSPAVYGPGCDCCGLI